MSSITRIQDGKPVRIVARQKFAIDIRNRFVVGPFITKYRTI